MESSKLVNQIILVSVAFSTSLALGLVTRENLNNALLIGLITIPASYAGFVVADQRRIAQEKKLKGSLQNQIKVLEEKKTELYQSVSNAKIIQQELEANTKSLKAERDRLLDRVAELHEHRNELYGEIRYFQEEKLEQEEQLHQKLQKLEQRQAELNQSLSVKTLLIYPAQTKLNLLKRQLAILQIKLTEKQKHRDQLNQYFTNLERNKQELEGEKYDLQTQIKVLKQRQDELNIQFLNLNYRISQLREEKAKIETSLVAGKEALDILLDQIYSKQKLKQQIDDNLANNISQNHPVGIN